jgi:hydroxyethylthiazole kinase-like uncharacterized protein yjeF
MSEPSIITPASLRARPLPGREGDKHARGTVVAIGGAAATVGAVILTGLAALRSGAGVLQVACDPAAAITVAVALPEARVVGWNTADLGDLVADADAVVIGPGLDDIDHTAKLLETVANRASSTDVVADAYALGALSRQPELLHQRDRPPVLTPSTNEARILLGDQDGDIDELSDAADNIARRYQSVVALRGHISAPSGEAWREEGGDVGLGTAGSGDVVAGLIAGLLAHGAAPLQAACWAAHVHAVAGQRLAARLGRTGFLARELLDETAQAIAALNT